MAIYFAPSIVVQSDADVNADNGVIGIHNLLTTASVSASSAASGYPASNLANDATDLEWNATSTAANTIAVDTSAYGNQIDYVGIAGHNLGSAGITFAIDVNTGSGYTNLVPAQLAVTDDPIIVRLTPATYTGVRISLGVGTSAARIAVVYVGKLLVLQRRIYVDHTPITMGYQQNATNGMSESGNYLGRIIVGATNATNIILTKLTASWYRTYFASFVVLARTKPFFYAWRPSSYPLEVGFVWVTAIPQPVNELSNGMMRVSLAVRGFVS